MNDQKRIYVPRLLRERQVQRRERSETTGKTSTRAPTASPFGTSGENKTPNLLGKAREAQNFYYFSDLKMGKKGGGNLGRQLVKKQTVHRKLDGKGAVGNGYLHTAELQVDQIEQ